MPGQRIADDAVVRVEVQLEGAFVRRLASWWREQDAGRFPAFPQPEWTDQEAAAFALAHLGKTAAKEGLALLVTVPLGPPPVDESEHVARGLVG